MIDLMMVFGEYEVMSEAVMSVFKEFSHVATPGRDPPGYQFPMLTHCILNFRSSSDVAVIGQRLLRHAAAIPVALAATQWKFWADLLLADLLAAQCVLPAASENLTLPIKTYFKIYETWCSCFFDTPFNPNTATSDAVQAEPETRKGIPRVLALT